MIGKLLDPKTGKIEGDAKLVTSGEKTLPQFTEQQLQKIANAILLGK